jgi:hypothetical protein
VDSRRCPRENQGVLTPEVLRRQIARTLNTAYADGLLSEDTFANRIDQLLEARLVDPLSLIGDLNLRGSSGGRRARLASTLANAVRRIGTARAGRPRDRAVLLALDWTGGERQLFLGRHHACDVVLSDPSVSRRHARLLFRGGNWVLQDLQSTNGTIVNGVRVGRCELWPGDHLVLGNKHLKID